MRKLASAIALTAAFWARSASADPVPAREELPGILACTFEQGYLALGSALFTEDWPKYLVESKREDRPLGYYGYELAEPVDFHGRQVREIGLVQDWIVAPLPRAEAQALAAELELERAPMRVAEQHFLFMGDDGAGPMFSVFELGSGLAALLPDEAPPDPVMYAGCNYRATTRDDFLAQAAQADGQVQQMRQEILEMLTKPDATEKD
ncbi:hypothetical protein ACFODL_17210 [Phenylobacterium terrae]|uniref:Uncharacterized protein n=1 Tax=Phenylobacterium terrae TaxID=2665495 RepID=A0ABW4N6T5_9CAUL